jgi:hypothetical protein
MGFKLWLRAYRANQGLSLFCISSIVEAEEVIKTTHSLEFESNLYVSAILSKPQKIKKPQ